MLQEAVRFTTVLNATIPCNATDHPFDHIFHALLVKSISFALLPDVADELHVQAPFGLMPASN
jgi:hypothetical protein